MVRLLRGVQVHGGQRRGVLGAQAARVVLHHPDLTDDRPEHPPIRVRRGGDERQGQGQARDVHAGESYRAHRGG